MVVRCPFYYTLTNINSTYAHLSPWSSAVLIIKNNSIINSTQKDFLTSSVSAVLINNISALAGMLLKSPNVYFFSTILVVILNNSDILFDSDCKRGN